MAEKFFKVSSGLKNLIGSDLITDNFVAMFELVKNSFDAKATKVTITFENIYSTDAKIIIQDDGKGMDYTDLTEKWLFVAYSAKRDGTEDYRNNIKSNRIYAGAKGVGRFSCDKLGRYLNLITLKDQPGSIIENLFIDWRKFEENQSVLFNKIPIVHNNLNATSYDLKKGTVLEITGIPLGFWSRDNFKNLKQRLSKLIRPDFNKSISKNNFKIILKVPDEIEQDNISLKQLKDENSSEVNLYYNTINGEIQNFVFNELDIKTTKIEARLSEDTITTRLTDRENFIYEIKEKNRYGLLNNIDITLYFLNHSAKITFTKRTGAAHVDFGSVFVYKNGFRVYPYGERNNDSFGIENRALQGYARYIGLRSLIGEISITGDNPDLRETTSRGDGLVKTAAYYQLSNTEDSYLIKTLRRLEKYVVDVTQWGVNDDDETKSISSEEVKVNLVKLIANISDDKSIIELKYNEEIIDIIAGKEEKSAKKLVRNFKRIAAESNDNHLLKDAAKIEKAITTSLQRADAAEKELVKKIEEKRRVEKELDVRKEQLSIATSIASQDLTNVTNLHHQVRVISDVINTELILFSREIEKGKHISVDDLKSFIQRIAFENSKIESISKFGTRAIFENFTDVQSADIIEFVRSYIEKITHYFSSSRLKVKFVTDSFTPFIIKFRPLDLSIVIDNMISNSKKAGASTLTIRILRKSNKTLEMIISDNGPFGLSNIPGNINSIFEKGFSTTKSTGLGLYHVKSLEKENNFQISANANVSKGAEFVLTFTA